MATFKENQEKEERDKTEEEKVNHFAMLGYFFLLVKVRKTFAIAPSGGHAHFDICAIKTNRRNHRMFLNFKFIDFTIISHHHKKFGSFQLLLID